MTLKSEWIDHCLKLCNEEADLYSGCRKIITARKLTFTCLDDSLQLEDAGYTKSKMSHLVRLYLHKESQDMAVQLWDKRRAQGKYGSVGFTTYNHFVKGGTIDAKRSKRASVFGPCIQSVVITLTDKKTVCIDVFYRTTELLKKFPADLVFLRDVLLKPFDLEGMTISAINCHFANITVHPMYFVTIVPGIKDPVGALIAMGKKDKYFRDWTVKWTARYTCDEFSRGIQKFAQAMRVAKDASERIKPRVLEKLNEYLRETHPGYRSGYVDPDETEEEE